jgi:hypothetical protein
MGYFQGKTKHINQRWKGASERDFDSLKNKISKNQ